jgi:DNA polymerase-4
VPAGCEATFLAPLSVRKIPGIGEVTEKALNARGIRTVGQLAQVPLETLEAAFGQWGLALYRKARGQDAFEFFVDAEPKSISHNHTFGEDVAEKAALEATLSHLTEKAGKRLRDAGLYARCVTLTIRYASFRTITRARTLRQPTDLDSVVLAEVKRQFAEHRDPRQKVRLLGVALSEFTHAATQMSLLEAEQLDRQERLARAADRLRDRYGFKLLRRAASLDADE